ncbi:MAG: asparaginase [Micromonosporaceae bacterium]
MHTAGGAPARATVAVFGLGGTISMKAPTGTSAAVPALHAGELLAGVPGLDEIDADLRVVDVRAGAGVSLGFADIHALAGSIAEALGAGASGAVVTQGTDTIEETAYLLDLLHTGPQPVVVTGAMRNPSLAGADGPANLLAAVQTAASSRTRGLGTLVVFADEIHAAARVRKSHTTSIGTFESPDSGPLGHVVEGEPRLLSRPAARLGIPDVPTRDRRVGLATISLDDHGELLAGAQGLDGLVVAGMGVGHVPPNLVEALAGLAGQLPVVLASRTGAGSTLENAYGFPGSERDLLGRGLIPAGFLHPLKARILLHTVLCADADRPTIATAFAVAGGRSDPAAWPWPTA